MTVYSPLGFSSINYGRVKVSFDYIRGFFAHISSDYFSLLKVLHADLFGFQIRISLLISEGIKGPDFLGYSVLRGGGEYVNAFLTKRQYPKWTR